MHSSRRLQFEHATLMVLILEFINKLKTVADSAQDGLGVLNKTQKVLWHNFLHKYVRDTRRNIIIFTEFLLTFALYQIIILLKRA